MLSSKGTQLDPQRRAKDMQEEEVRGKRRLVGGMKEGG